MTARRRAWRRGGLLAPAASAMLICGTAAGCTSPEPEPEPQPVVSVPEGAVVHELRAGTQPVVDGMVVAVMSVGEAGARLIATPESTDSAVQEPVELSLSVGEAVDVEGWGRITLLEVTGSGGDQPGSGGVATVAIEPAD